MTVSDAYWSQREGRRGPDECWDWTGKRAGEPDKQYGLVHLGGGRWRRATHVALERIGVHPQPGQDCVLHSCDRPPCVNPRHLRWGNRSQNTSEAYERGLKQPLRGESHGMARLSDDEVAQIREKYAAGARQVDLAAEYGVRQGHISRLVRRAQR